MNLLLRRIISRDDHTLGLLTCDGLEMWTLEDQRQDTKVPGETRIPAGLYDIDIRTDTPMAKQYRARFGGWHEGMIWLRDVPDFEYVYIHVGNTPKDTEGCILVGLTAEIAGQVGNSTGAYITLAQEVFAAKSRGEEVNILIGEPL